MEPVKQTLKNLQGLLEEESPLNLKYLAFFLHDFMLAQMLNWFGQKPQKVPFGSVLSVEVWTQEMYAEDAEDDVPVSWAHLTFNQQCLVLSKCAEQPCLLSEFILNYF